MVPEVVEVTAAFGAEGGGEGIPEGTWGGAGGGGGGGPCDEWGDGGGSIGCPCAGGGGGVDPCTAWEGGGGGVCSSTASGGGGGAEVWDTGVDVRAEDEEMGMVEGTVGAETGVDPSVKS